jgi:hypothetical protein
MRYSAQNTTSFSICMLSNITNFLSSTIRMKRKKPVTRLKSSDMMLCKLRNTECMIQLWMGKSCNLGKLITLQEMFFFQANTKIWVALDLNWTWICWILVCLIIWKELRLLIIKKELSLWNLWANGMNLDLSKESILKKQLRSWKIEEGSSILYL